MPSLAYLVLLKGHFPGFAAKVWCKAVRHGKAVGRSGIGRNIILLTAVFRLGISEVDIVCNDFGTAALAAFLVRPVADLEPAMISRVLAELVLTNSAVARQATISIKSVSFSPFLDLKSRSTAIENEQTAVPLSVLRSSGSRVSLPIRMILFSIVIPPIFFNLTLRSLPASYK